MARTVVLVTGPPCAGKSTHVAQHAKPGDLILDQDVIGAQAMRQELARLASMTDGTAWVIRCAPGPRKRDALARQINATDVVLLRPPDDELLRRAAHRPHPRRHIQAVRDWLRRETEDTPATRGQRKPRGHTAQGAHRTTTQRGYGWEHQKARAKAITHLRQHPGQPCPFCQQPMYVGMALDYDHYPPLALGGGGVRRLSCSPCNRRAGQAIAQQRIRARKQPRTTKPAVNSQRW